jgi:hypothetical protein
LILELVTVYFVLRALWLMYKSFTAEGLTDFERGEMFGEATFDIVTVIFGEEIVKWLGEWFKGAEVAAGADELAELRKLVPDEALLNRLLKSVGGDAKELKALLGLLGNDGVKLEELLALTGNDSAKVRELVGLAGGDGPKAAELVRKANGNSGRVTELLRGTGGDVGKVEAALEAAVDLEKAGMDGAFIDAMNADGLTGAKKLLSLANNDGAAVQRLLDLCGKNSGQVERFLKAVPNPSELERLIGEASGAPPAGSGPDRIASVLDRIGEGPHSVANFETELQAQVKIDAKILRGEINPGGRLIGGHSPEILTSPDFQVIGTPTTNANGTIVAKFKKILSPGPPPVLSPTKQSTLAPRGWTDADILSAGEQVSNTPAVETRISDHATLHTGSVRGVDWVVIKDGSGRVISSFPTGGSPFHL